MSSLMLAVLASLALVTATHFIPWMMIFRRGLPGLIMYAIHLANLVFPLILLFLDWGKYPLSISLCAIPQVGLWITSICLMAAADLAMEFILYMIDRYLQQRTSMEAAQDEIDSLKASLE
jgi:hypothetical protein